MFLNAQYEKNRNKPSTPATFSATNVGNDSEIHPNNTSLKMKELFKQLSELVGLTPIATVHKGIELVFAAEMAEQAGEISPTEKDEVISMMRFLRDQKRSWPAFPW